ncbi:hypothetical protein VTL71DRAFT_13658 [Oculimacula yallundae]|uniref:Uncharacterized protein n=1 Tax=Oculimacula yallundae TaxID=86028 RepID=A0ABR4CLL7_9HELO
MSFTTFSQQPSTMQDIQSFYTRNTAPAIQSLYNFKVRELAEPPLPIPTQTQTQTPSLLLSLPLELIYQIATQYFSSLPPLLITPQNLHLPLHVQTPLSLSSPIFSLLIPSSLYYQHARFVFEDAAVMREFAGLYGRRERVRKVEVSFGGVGLRRERKRVDWVFQLLEAFGGLGEVGFVFGDTGIDREGAGEEREAHKCLGEGALGTWWECVVDAVREGVAARASVDGRGKRAGLVLRLECEGFLWSEKVGGGKGSSKCIRSS